MAIEKDSKEIPFEDDLVVLKPPYIDPLNKNITKKSETFGIVVKTTNLKDMDPAIMPNVREVIRNLSNEKTNEKTYTVLEFHVITKYKMYVWEQGIVIDYEVKL